MTIYTAIGFSNNLVETDQGFIDTHKKIHKLAFKISYFKGIKLGDKIYSPNIKEGELIGSFLDGTALIRYAGYSTYGYRREESVSPIISTSYPASSSCDK